MSGPLERTNTSAPVVDPPTPDTLTIDKLDIEHVEVENDPRKWSPVRKTIILVTVSSAAIVVGLGANLYNPAIAEVEADLHASSGGISFSISLFILAQGVFPLFWSAISEIHGRKLVYIASFGCGVVGCVVAANAKSIGVLIGMRVIQGAGSSSVLSMGAATLSDQYEPRVRGTMMGIFYSAPLLGPALGPIIGGVLTEAFNWRATFWFIAAFSALYLFIFAFSSDTFRRERSLTYQIALKRRRKGHNNLEASNTSGGSSVSHETVVSAEKQTKKEDQMEKGTSGSVTPVPEPTHATEQAAEEMPNGHVRTPEETEELKDFKLSFKDINFSGPIRLILARRNNLVILFSSGLLFAFSNSLTYTCALSLGTEYGYNALQIGLVLLAFGAAYPGASSADVGQTMFSLVLNQRMAVSANQSTFIWMIFLPLSCAAYGWVTEKHVNVAAICVFLFLCGFFSIAIYASTLAYIVDANGGRSSLAVATNSFFRGVSAFVAIEIAVPLQSAIGDGGLYTFWAGLMIISELLCLLVWWKGGNWREKAEEKERQGAHGI